jgi:hypothetical protein
MQGILTDYRDVPQLTQAALIAANIIPLLGVVFFGWQITTLLTVYWAETGVIGLYSLAKIFTSSPGGSGGGDIDNQAHAFGTAYKILIGGFFCVHFGVFMLVHGVFLFAFFAQSTSIEAFNFAGVFAAIIGLFISHGISFYRNYLKGGEYKKLNPKNLMSQPYQRVIIMHFVIIIGAFATTLLGGFRMVALVLLVVLKTVVDLRSHIQEHMSVKTREGD